MKLEYATMIVEAAETINLDIELRPDYSGRSMFGKTTVALIAPSMAEFTAAACEAAVRLERRDEWSDRFIDAVRVVSTDSMGRDSIVIY